MASSTLTPQTIGDVLKFSRAGELIINDEYQRGEVWSEAGKAYLIDTVLRNLPIPKIFIRAYADPSTQRISREVVDGQQRIRAILDFAEDRLRLKLKGKAADWDGRTYSELEEDHQRRFLEYLLSIEQLQNASDEDVIDIFERLNTYNTPLNSAELRHARYQTRFKSVVRETAADYAGFWTKYGVLTRRQRVRKQDDELIAEMIGILLRGVAEGDADSLETLYREQYDRVFTPGVAKRVTKQLGDAVGAISADYGAVLRAELAKPYQFLMLYAAYVHSSVGLPPGRIGDEEMPARQKLAPVGVVVDRLAALLGAFELDEPSPRDKAFADASSATTRMSSRKPRFLRYYEDLTDPET